MSFLKTALGFAAGGPIGGLIGNQWDSLTGHSNPAMPNSNRAPATAKDISIDSKLTSVLGEQGQGAQNSLKDVYSRIRSRVAADNSARGVRNDPTGGYEGNRLATAENFSNQGLRGGLEDILGSSGYTDWKGVRDFNQNMDLARYTGELNKPSILEEVLGGLSGAASVGGQFAGATKGKSKMPMPAPQPSSYPLHYGPYSGVDPSMMSVYDPYEMYGGSY